MRTVRRLTWLLEPLAPIRWTDVQSEQKATVVKDFQQKGERVEMAGDGIMMPPPRRRRTSELRWERASMER